MAGKLQLGAARKRKVEIFSAGCGVCDQTIKMINLWAGRWDEVTFTTRRMSKWLSAPKVWGCGRFRQFSSTEF